VAVTGFSDPFDSLEGGRWSAGDHQLGRSRLDPANAVVAGGALELRHPAGTLRGGTALFSTYAGGRQTHTETRAIGFDPTAAHHDYAIELDRRSVTFRVDGVALRSWSNGVPGAPMALHLNSWFPAWLAGTPSPGAATLVDRVDVTP
jgi:licheninase